MLRVRMKTHITGYRNGEPWPQRGGHIDLPDNEAADLVANGYAAIVGEASGSPTDDGLEGLGVRKLRSLARDAGLELAKDAGKDELVEALRAHHAEQARQHAAALAAVQGGQPDGGPDSTAPGDPGRPADPADGSDGAPASTPPPAAGDKKPARRAGRSRKRTGTS